MNCDNIYFDPVRNCAFDAHGKELSIKTRSGKRWINYKNKQVNVKSLTERFLIRDFDDFIFLYILGGLSQTHPCIAMEKYVNIKAGKR